MSDKQDYIAYLYNYNTNIITITITIITITITTITITININIKSNKVLTHDHRSKQPSKEQVLCTTLRYQLYVRRSK